MKDNGSVGGYQICGKEDPFLKIGKPMTEVVKGESDYVWSLRDINFGD